jgi:hypothetical protein
MHYLKRLVLALAILAGGCWPADAPTRDELDKACPGAARVAAVECPLLAVAECGDSPTFDACPKADAVRAECKRRLAAELDLCL